MIPADKEHTLGEIDDDGNRDRFSRHRYVCRCGKAGAWRESVQLVKGEHAVHRSAMKEVDLGRDLG